MSRQQEVAPPFSRALSPAPTDDDSSGLKKPIADTSSSARYPPVVRGYMTLTILIVAYVISLVDRQVLSLMVGPIRAALGIDDIQVGLLQGFSFALFYCVLGIPLGRLADRGNRRLIIAFGMTFWSAATIACAFADSFATLFVARMCVGVGEAALAPAAYSLLADTFAPKRLVRANALFSMGAMLGGGFALVVGGMTLDYATRVAHHVLGGTFQPWQLVFISLGMPGMILTAVLLAAVKEPKRLDDQPLPSMREACKHLWQLRSHLVPLYVCSTLLAAVLFANLGWLPTYFMRTYQTTPSYTGLALGIALMAGCVVGSTIGPSLTAQLFRRGYRDAHMRTVLIASIAILPTVLGTLFHNQKVTLIAACLYFLVQNSYFGAVTASMQAVIPNRLRAMNSGLLFLIMNLVGLGGGTVIVAWTASHVFANASNSIGQAITSVSLVAATGSAIVAALTMKRYRHHASENSKA
ncbi:putative MFS family arabinose efflux permease [Paraburkholderia sp. BL23I1N1]|uniref:spinster family MFS transporter n=1 Tax=Paraburkholderia sp. BL23I1N1 TaxID=1938802 RepID=UPI000E71C18B|nr:MFS transporter [Paraburkholderia sp. BL23I1N1]RKE38625.1 putative MFS family arabinose efflux permease [Paraburkholderia sp. BL23I1N1]